LGKVGDAISNDSEELWKKEQNLRELKEPYDF